MLGGRRGSPVAARSPRRRSRAAAGARRSRRSRRRPRRGRRSPSRRRTSASPSAAIAALAGERRHVEGDVVEGPRRARRATRDARSPRSGWISSIWGVDVVEPRARRMSVSAPLQRGGARDALDVWPRPAIHAQLRTDQRGSASSMSATHDPDLDDRSGPAAIPRGRRRLAASSSRSCRRRVVRGAGRTAAAAPQGQAAVRGRPGRSAQATWCATPAIHEAGAGARSPLPRPTRAASSLGALQTRPPMHCRQSRVRRDVVSSDHPERCERAGATATGCASRRRSASTMRRVARLARRTAGASPTETRGRGPGARRCAGRGATSTARGRRDRGRRRAVDVTSRRAAATSSRPRSRPSASTSPVSSASTSAPRRAASRTACCSAARRT